MIPVKTLLVAYGLSWCSGSLAGDVASPAFPNERIGIPPLSLSEAIAGGPADSKPLQFGTRLPGPGTNREARTLSPQLVPRVASDVLRGGRSAAHRSPRVSRSMGMPVIEPNDAVEYSMRVVPPDPAVDFKLVIKDPLPAERPR